MILTRQFRSNNTNITPTCFYCTDTCRGGRRRSRPTATGIQQVYIDLSSAGVQGSEEQATLEGDDEAASRPVCAMDKVFIVQVTRCLSAQQQDLCRDRDSGHELHSSSHDHQSSAKQYTREPDIAAPAGSHDLVKTQPCVIHLVRALSMEDLDTAGTDSGLCATCNSFVHMSASL